MQKKMDDASLPRFRKQTDALKTPGRRIFHAQFPALRHLSELGRKSGIPE